MLKKIGLIVFFAFLIVLLNCQAGLPRPTAKNQQKDTSVSTTSNTETQINTESDDDDNDDITFSVILIGGATNFKQFNLEDLNQEQKEVDKFIREKENLPKDANLTGASGNDDQFVYTYSQETQKSCHTWIYTLKKNQESETEQKYVIVGMNKISVGQPTEQQKKQMEENMKGFDEEMKKLDQMMASIFE